MIAMHMYPGDVAFFPLLDRTRSQFQCELTRVAAPLGLWKISTTSLVTGSHGSLQRAETFMSFLASSSKLRVLIGVTVVIGGNGNISLLVLTFDTFFNGSILLKQVTTACSPKLNARIGTLRRKCHFAIRYFFTPFFISDFQDVGFGIFRTWSSCSSQFTYQNECRPHSSFTS